VPKSHAILYPEATHRLKIQQSIESSPGKQFKHFVEDFMPTPPQDSYIPHADRIATKKAAFEGCFLNTFKNYR
jgi:hypothetical protein